ncbi:phage virion morphogenesis protein [Roseospira goensis]|uniref:Phage gpG-like protein n=1 Tax=Roseospira goensis TaxID=391922 RepID=A0A7W6S2P9_9PROT|nr:phage virion morphogenesis protein [Roseospira goensis]MBB4287796.1 phage gpG-like protein [Roseospira goensis]
MAGISIEVSGDDIAARGLDAIVGRAADMTRAMDSIGAMMRTSVLHRFQEGVDPDGEDWPPSIRAIMTDGKTLVDRGHLRDSVTYAADADSVRQGTNLVYARIHQLGGTIKIKARTQTITRRLYKDGTLSERFVKRTARNAVSTDHQVAAHTITMPARPYLGLSAQDRQQAGEIVADWVTGAWS